MFTPKANHHLELVGGRHFNDWSRRLIGPHTISLERLDSETWGWLIVAGGLVAEGYAPTRDEAIAAAEAALIEEISKFVRVKQ